MIRNQMLIILLASLLVNVGCRRNNEDVLEVTIPDFNYPKSITFETNLSAYNIYKGNPSSLTPAEDFHLLELNSILFTDYAYKQRLIKVPDGMKVSSLSDGSLSYPDGTILVKTFYYYKDENDTSLGKNLIESRLLIKENNIWNIATYEWNDAQTEAKLSLNGVDKQVAWVDKNGSSRSTQYHLPSQNECITCHQSGNIMTPIGPSIRNLNREVMRGGNSTNQIDYLQEIDLLASVTSRPTIIDYNDLSKSVEDRARAYLDMNCAHCHNPYGWDKSSERDFDFRYETPMPSTGLLFGHDKVERAIISGEMPFIGTTILDEEGISLVLEYLHSL